MRDHHLSLAHYVLFGMFIGFGLSSVVLGIYVVTNQPHQLITNTNSRSRRDIQDLTTTSSPQPTPPHKGHIDIVVANANIEEIFADEGLVVADPQDSHERVYTLLLGEESSQGQYEQAVSRTWGPELPHHQLIYWSSQPGSKTEDTLVPVKEEPQWATYGYTHLLRGVQHMCGTLYHSTLYHSQQQQQQQQQGYSWYVLAQDSVYIQPSTLLAILDRLSSSDPLLIGKPVPSHPSSCWLQQGAVLSREAMVRLCPRLHLCVSPEHQHQPGLEAATLLSQCLYSTAGLSCIHGNRLHPTFHVDSAASLTTPYTAFVGPGSAPSRLYSTHDLLSRLRIQAMQHNIVLMQAQISTTGAEELNQEEEEEDLEARPKRESVWNDSDDHIPFQSTFLNTSATPFRNFIDFGGYMYKSSCHLHRYDITGPGSSFQEIKEEAGRSLDDKFTVDQSLSFGYKLEKAKTGVEYDFYFVESGESGFERVHQVTVEQEQGDVQVMKKEHTGIRDITFITTVPHGYPDVRGYLTMMNENCEKLKAIGERACTVLLYLHHNDSTYSGVQHSAVNEVLTFKYVHPNFHLDYVEINQDLPFSSLLSLVHSTVNGHILAFLPADARINLDFLLRCQFNTKLQEKVYFPVALHSSDIDPPTRTLRNIDPDTSFWINQHFDTFCAYGSDIEDFEARIQEPQDVYSLFLWAGFQVSRKPDPSLQISVAGLCAGLSETERIYCMRELKYTNMG